MSRIKSNHSNYLLDLCDTTSYCPVIKEDASKMKQAYHITKNIIPHQLHPQKADNHMVQSISWTQFEMPSMFPPFKPSCPNFRQKRFMLLILLFYYDKSTKK